MTSPREIMLLIVRVWLAPGCDLSEYQGFEREAATIMKSHGGRIERAFRVHEAHIEDEPFEIHVVSFPDESAFTSYRNDARTRALAEKRDRLLARTEIWSADEVSYEP